VTGGTKGAGEAIMRRFALAGHPSLRLFVSSAGATEARLCAGGLSSVEGIAQLADCIMKKWGASQSLSTALEI